MEDETKLKESIATLADMTRKSMEIDLQIENINEEGVKIIEVKSKSSAADEGLRSGDIIKTVGRRIIKDESDYFDMIKNYDIGDIIMLRIIRNNNAQYIAFKIK